MEDWTPQVHPSRMNEGPFEYAPSHPAYGLPCDGVYTHHWPTASGAACRRCGTVMQTNPQQSNPVDEAYELGCEHARNAASWVVDGNTDERHVRVLLAMMEDGDPAVFDYLPREPNLSGEFAGHLTPAGLAYDILGVTIDSPTYPAALIDDLCDAYERGVSDTFQPECERILRAFVA